jgi:hypothetical protein
MLPLDHAVRRLTLKRSASTASGSKVGEYMATGAPPDSSGRVCFRMLTGSMVLAQTRPLKPPARVVSTTCLVRANLLRFRWKLPRLLGFHELSVSGVAVGGGVEYDVSSSGFRSWSHERVRRWLRRG